MSYGNTSSVFLINFDIKINNKFHPRKQKGLRLPMEIIFHIASPESWQQAQSTASYQSETLASEGFIHCSTVAQIVTVANRFFGGQEKVLLLCIDSEKVKAEIKYEESEPNQFFPHIYGEINVDAVLKVINWQAQADKMFYLTSEIEEILNSNE